MRIFVRYLLGLLVVLLVGTGLLWLERERLTDTFLRPWLIERAATELHAEVEIENLHLDWGEISLTGLSIAKADSYELRIERVLVRMSKAVDLLKRRLSTVVLQNPRLVVNFREGEKGSNSVPAVIPPAPPLVVEGWRIEGGQLQLLWPDRQIRVSEISANGRLDRKLTFQVEGQIGRQEEIPFAVSGQGVWQENLSLTLEEILWKKQALLPEPVTFHSSTPGKLSGRISLETLSDGDLAGLFAMLEISPPWPDNVGWTVRQPSLAFRLEERDLHLDIRTLAGTLKLEDQNWPWQEASMQIKQAGSSWNLDGSLALAEDSLVGMTGRWADNSFAGEWRLQSPHPYHLAQTMPVSAPVSLNTLFDLEMHGRIAQDSRGLRFTDGKLSGRLKESVAVTADFVGSWQNGEFSVEIDRSQLVDKSRQEPLMTASGNLVWKAAASTIGGEFKVDGNSLNRLGQALGIDQPPGLPQFEDFNLQGKIRRQNSSWSLPVAFTSGFSGQGFAGQMAADLTVHWNPGSGLRGRIEQWLVTGLEYGNPQGTIVMTGGRLEAAGSVAAAEEMVIFDFRGQVEAAEALVGSWYGDLQGVPLEFNFQGSWPSAGQAFSLAGVEVDLGGLLTANFQGNLGGPRNALQGQIKIDPLSGDFQAALQRFTVDLLPEVKHLVLAGSLSVDFRAEHQAKGLAVDLKFHPENVTFGWGETLRWHGLTGTLPVRLRLGDWPEESAEEWMGRLQWKQLQGVLLDSGQGTLIITAEPNRWRLMEPVTLSAAGGQIEMRSLQFRLIEMAPDLQMSVRLAGVELERISKAFDWPVMAGQLAADLESVQLNAERVRTNGKAEIGVFGGKFQVRNMRIESPLSRFPTYHADIDFAGLDLFQLTKTFAFGEINGIADGYVRDLRLFNGLPSTFQAKFETRVEGERNISVKAIRNLNTLSQGGLSAALSSGVYQFIDFYRYRKIGLRCFLENDVFHLEGTARNEAGQYLVHGGWLPPKIDVIISSPTISFKEMVKRLKRIERTEN